MIGLVIDDMYKKTLQYKTSVISLSVARGVIIFCLVLFIFGVISKVELFFKIMLACFVISIILSLTALLLVIGLKCEVCHKQHSIIFKNSEGKYKYRPKNEFEALINDFYPIEIRLGRFKCVHCGAEYLLKKMTNENEK